MLVDAHRAQRIWERSVVALVNLERIDYPVSFVALQDSQGRPVNSQTLYGNMGLHYLHWQIYKENCTPAFTSAA